MQAIKQLALDTIQELPEDVDLDEIMYRLYVLDKVRKGRQAVDQGRILAGDDLKRQMESW